MDGLNHKVIYMESTLNLLIQIEGLEYVKQLCESGEIKTLETVTNYLVI